MQQFYMYLVCQSSVELAAPTPPPKHFISSYHAVQEYGSLHVILQTCSCKCFNGWCNYHSNSTGYFPVRQAVQWPTLPLDLLLLLNMFSFS